MAITRLKLTRDQLAAFLGKDSEAIKQFEQLFSTTQDLSTSVQDELTNAATNAEARAQQAIDTINRLADSLDALAMAPVDTPLTDVGNLLPPVEPVTPYQDLTPPHTSVSRTRYGTFFDTTTQTAALTNTAYAVTFNSTDLSNGVFIVSNSRITVDTEGIYNFQFSMQLEKTTFGKGIFDLWFRKNGTDIPDSATRVRLQGNNAETVAAWNYVLKLAANDYLEFVWATDTTSVQIQYFPAAAPVPAIPSVILSVTNNIG